MDALETDPVLASLFDSSIWCMASALMDFMTSPEPKKTVPEGTVQSLGKLGNPLLPTDLKGYVLKEKACEMQ
ncbi:hypothetical protein [Coralliovum pocilloporae]|uniref:hypothetical protein n=1 Tax=Coralliovum pocilloporae TaxID=3066369 RepID=UPI003306D660